MNKPKKIAVLGGGISSLTTILEITNTPNWKEKYDITLYQRGWRIGGKGASGRNPDQNQRIEEHGLHLWFGFYDNAFDLMKTCYKENNRSLDKPLATWNEAFKPSNFVVLEDRVKSKWSHWALKFPENNKEPGLDKDFTPITMKEYLKLGLEFVRQMYKSYSPNYKFQEDPQEAGGVKSTFQKIKQWIGVFALERCTEIIFAALKLIDHLEDINPKTKNKFLQYIDSLLKKLWNEIKDYIDDDKELHRMWVLIDFAIANIKGVIADDVINKGFDVINKYDYREWLKIHGATDITLDSGPVQGVYGLVFGGYKHYTFEAGTALRGALRMMYTYKGAIYYKMQAGMGDVVFSPIYEVLKKRGVTFKFFHDIKNLKLSPDKKSIAEIEIGKQVHLKEDKEYQPFVDVKGLPCWPSYPLFDQIVDGEKLKESGANLEIAYTKWDDVETFSLKKNEDFDLCVFGISIGAIKNICKEILVEREDWRNMVKHVTATPTQAFQLWMKPDNAGMGWPFWNQELPLDGSYEEPYDTWCDMSDLIIREDWNNEFAPNNISYLCGPLMDPKEMSPLTDHDFPEKMLALAKANALEYMKKYSHHLWKNTQDENGEFNWNLLIDTKNQTGEKRFDDQYFRVNVDPSELYVLSETNSTKYRLKTDENGFDNLLITGDWILNGLNAGCIEASVMCGKQTARAIKKENYPIPWEKDYF